MASDPITGLPLAAALTGSDPIVTVQAGVTVQSDVDAMKAFMDASPIMQFKGQADASAVDEDAATGTSIFQTGDVYRINVAASAPHAFSDISEDLLIGDWVVFNGTIFQKQDGTDPTAAETKTAYESNADTNAFTDAEQTKLGGIEALADVTDTANVDAAGAVMETDYNAQTVLLAVADNTPLPVIVGASSFVGRKATGDVGTMTDVEARAVLNVEDGATADQTDVEIKTAYENNANTNEFSDAEQSKLAGIEALADVTDTANVDAAGAVMETDYNAQTVLLAVADNTPLPITVAASSFVGRKATGDVGVMTPDEANIVLGTDALLAAEEILFNDQSSGVIDGGIISINADTTKFDFTAVKLHIVDSFTDPLNPTIIIVEITAQVAIAATEVATDNETFVGIRLDNVAPTGGTATAVSATVDGSAGTVYITQKPSDEYTREETRDIVQIGELQHPGVVITQVFNLQQIVNNIALQLYDFVFAVGIINISGNEFSANGVNLNIDKSAGDIFRQGSNNDGTAAGLKNPNISTVVAASVATFKYRFQDGAGGFTVGSDTTTVDPDQYDDGDGVLGTVGNNKWTIQKLYVGPAGDIRIEYGQVIYNSESEAEAAISVVTITDPVLIAETAFRGWLIVKKGTVDLSNTADAKFIAAGKFNDISPGTMVGEINTASNVGTGGIDVFKQKTGVNLEFNNINANSSKIVVTLNGGLNEIRIDAVPANFNTGDLNNDAGFLANLVEDTAPQLGGNLDLNGNVITGLIIGTDVQAWSAILDATTASFQTADETKLDGIETLADVTDTANVTAAGALMDSEVDADLKTLVLPASTTISIFGASLIDDADASAARTTLELIIGTDVQAFDADTAKLDVAQEYTATQNFNATSLTASGSDLVTNGGFATDTDWTKGTGWTIAAGVASSDGTQSADADLTQALSLVNGQTYEVEFTISNYSAGNVTPVAGDVEGTDRAANGTFTENIVAGAGGDIDIRADLDFVGDIDNVTVKLANVSWDLESNQVTVITLDADLVLDNPTNMVDGATYILRLIQDAIGSRTMTFGTAYKFPSGVAPTLSIGVNDVDIITFISDGTNMFGVFQGDFS